MYSIFGFPYNLLPVSYGDIGVDQVLASKSGRKVPLLTHGPPCPMKTIQLGDLASRLQITPFGMLEIFKKLAKPS
jgi:hypothetical protein